MATLALHPNRWEYGGGWFVAWASQVEVALHELLSVWACPA